MLEENLLKSCLKRKVTFTTSTLVKFLITGTVALSLTACGGGGGGSSSSGGNGGVIEKPFEENKTDRTETIKTENQNFINKGKVDLTGNKTEDSVAGIIGKDSDITNEAEIKINDISTSNSKILLASETGKDILKELQNQGKSFAIFAEGGKVVNGEDGKLNITGDNVIGIVGVSSDITNDGKITTSDNIDDTEEAVGIMAIGSSVENNGDIKLVSHKGIGILGINNSNLEIINNGTITINTTIKEDTDIEGDDPLDVYLEDFSYGIKTDGKVINEAGGTINITGTAIGMTGKNVINNGIINVTGIEADDDEKVKTPAGIYVSGEGSEAINNHIIQGTGNFSGGMFAYEGATAINGENGIITTDRGFDAYYGHIINHGKVETTGHAAEIAGGTLENYGTMSSLKEDVIYVDEAGTATNKCEIIVNYLDTIGMNAVGNISDDDIADDILINSKVINEKEGKININGESSEGMVAEGLGAEAINRGTIIINKRSKAMSAYEGGTVKNEKDAVIEIKNAEDTSILKGVNGTIINEGKINLSAGDWLTGIEISGGTAENSGIINVSSNSATGIRAEDAGTATNKWKINVNDNNKGMEALGALLGVPDENTPINSKVINEKGGIINVNGKNSQGMRAEGNGAEAVNSGSINVNGEGSYGMVAFGQGAKATNEKDGIINVGAKASGAMLANGGAIYNYGTINIHKDNSITETNEIDGKEGKEIVLKSALEVLNGGTAYNAGTINTNQDFTIETDSTSSYTIGTDTDGSYGKVSAEKVSVDGNVRVSAKMAEGSYRSSYALNDVFTGKTELGKNYKLSSTSLLYSASSKVDEKGNLDVELTRNNRTVADFTNKKFVQAAGIFDKALADEEYRNTLSESDKALVDKIFGKTTSAKEVDEAIKQVSGYEYGNIARQMFDTKDLFKSYDKSIIDSLGDYDFNFNFIGAYADVDSKHGIAGYDSKVTGIAGAMKFTESLYGVIGYGYNNIDYDGNSDGNIQTVHTGLYKDIKSSYGNIRLGVFGEYNFHETDRDVLGEKSDSDFNSYLAGAEAEISRKFGDDLYFKPVLSFDISYGKYENFTENGSSDLKVESQDYVSAVPAIELRAGKMFGMSEIYSAVKYSYEFGDMNKSQNMELFEKFTVENDNIENAQTDLKLGTVINVKNISVNAEVGKEFGKRDREYVKAGFTYTF